jgi:hypothetical protein
MPSSKPIAARIVTANDDMHHRIRQREAAVVRGR